MLYECNYPFCMLALNWFEYPDDMDLLPGDYLVLIELKYDYEDDYSYMVDVLSVDMEYNEMLLSDCWEGQQHYKFLAIAPIDFQSPVIHAMLKALKDYQDFKKESDEDETKDN